MNAVPVYIVGKFTIIMVVKDVIRIWAKILIQDLFSVTVRLDGFQVII